MAVEFPSAVDTLSLLVELQWNLEISDTRGTVLNSEGVLFFQVHFYVLTRHRD